MRSPKWCRKLFQPISSRFTIRSSDIFSLIFCIFSISLVIENNEFTGVQEFSAPPSALPEYESLVQKAFEKFIGQHQFTGDQILFLRAVQSVFLRNRQLELIDLYDERSLQRFGTNAVDRLFTNDQVRALMTFTQEIAA
jgi:EcoEI R protein C-terminal